MKKVCEPVTESINDVSAEVTKTLTETSKENDKAPAKVINKLSKIMDDRGILASYLLSPLSKITNAKATSQFNPKNDLDSIRAMTS